MPITQNPYQKLARIAAWMAFLQAATVVFAVVGYFIWPHIFSDYTGRKVLEGIIESPGRYFMKLDPVVLIGTLLQLPVYLGLWAVLHKKDASLSLLALSIGLVSTVASLPTRPIRELYFLASFYESAPNPEAREGLVAAAEGLLSQAHGTAWVVSIMCGGLAAILFAVVMRQSGHFRRTTFWTMLISGVGAVVVLIPTIGLIALFLLATLVGIVASIFCGLDLFKFSRQ